MGNNGTFRMSKEYVRELHLAEERFLEVLISSFDIRRRKPPADGFELDVGFNEKTPAIWDHGGVRYLRDAVLPAKMRHSFQEKLDTFLYRGGAGTTTPNKLDFHKDPFLFRFVSGGTLPMIRFSDDRNAKEYYCLNYRAIEPGYGGWNIFNGGSDSREEMLDPLQTIIRELHEELIVYDPDKKVRYVFTSKSGKARDLPVHAVARALLDELVPQKNLKGFTDKDLDVTWVNGPDSVCIRMGNDEPVPRNGFFLNVNGSDFGIELDKVARIKLPESAIMFFGETNRGHLLKSPIGLFDVTRFRHDCSPEDLQKEVFRPDLFFYDGILLGKQDIDSVLAEPYRDQLRLHLWPHCPKQERARFEARLNDEARYALCPVTARIILRHRRWVAEKRHSRKIPGTGICGAVCTGGTSAQTAASAAPLKVHQLGELLEYDGKVYRFSGEERWKWLRKLINGKGRYVQYTGKGGLKALFANYKDAKLFFNAAIEPKGKGRKGDGHYRLKI